MKIAAILQNHVLWSGLIAWILAQAIKPPIDYLHSRHWNWALAFTTGGMPSSHSALITGTAMAIGLHQSFGDPLFGLAVAVSMIIVYDAAGIRRQAGMQAQKINAIMNELLKGHLISQDQLREVLGHTPLEAAGGVLLGIVTAVVFWLIWR